MCDLMTIGDCVIVYSHSSIIERAIKAVLHFLTKQR